MSWIVQPAWYQICQSSRQWQTTAFIIKYLWHRLLFNIFFQIIFFTLDLGKHPKAGLTSSIPKSSVIRHGGYEGYDDIDVSYTVASQSKPGLLYAIQDGHCDCYLGSQGEYSCKDSWWRNNRKKQHFMKKLTLEHSFSITKCHKLEMRKHGCQ